MSVATKNPFDLLGNDDGDSDTPTAPVKTVDKTSTHTVKRNTDGLGSATQAPARGGSRRGGIGGNEGAFRDRNAGSDRNRAKTTDESAPRDAPRGGRDARARGGRGGRFPRERDDRHAKNNTAETTEKAASQGWGAVEGEAALKDEQAGEEMAQAEKRDAAHEDAEAPDAEPEPKTMSLQDYLAQQAEKKLALQTEGSLKPRQPNEGSKTDKKWANAKPLAKENDEDYFAGTGGKAKRERERKTKQGPADAAMAAGAAGATVLLVATVLAAAAAVDRAVTLEVPVVTLEVPVVTSEALVVIVPTVVTVVTVAAVP
ncbi:hypothetical protein P8C59_000403 [Phyllachora maydis]|uniref:Hyaluronan/mRNA-binding protein domain-containing protein n=1 Tax=Phyllachora maydis TaxID=1825666 RepID=A0AAD9HW05_9PEZI|nr:hypothetical protein P8C59_000403 [Phyllachora maydis]